MTTISKKITIESELEKQLIELNDIILNSQGVIITGHINPDGDDIGSQLALGEYLQQIGKKHIIIDDDDVPQLLRFLPNTHLIHNFKNLTVDTSEYDLMIVVDSGDIYRIGQVRELVTDATKIVNIDHHLGNSLFGHLNLIKENACSIGEILYYFFMVNNIPISYNMAIDIYISIVTDTGSFKYDQMHPGVHIIATDLLERGIIPSEFNIFLYQSRSINYVRLLSLTLSRLELFSDNRIAVSYLLIEDFAGQDNDTDGLIENMGVIDSVSVYFLLKEKEPGLFSASMRSKYDVDVAKIAAHFGGGGHMRAAGCKTRDLSLTEFKNQLLELIIPNL